MSGKFIRQFEAGARAMTLNASLAPSDMFDLLQETATIHSDMLGYDMGFFLREKKGWLLLCWNAEIERLPKWREKITVETWPTEGRGLVKHRSFRALDENGATYMKAVSQWVLFDLVRRRPIKLSDEMVAAYSSGLADVLPAAKIKAETPDENSKIAESRLTVRRSHTDSNRHVNNVSYIKWAEDNLPDEEFFNRRLESIYVNYRKETKENAEIITSTYRPEEDRFVHIIKGTDGGILAEVVMNYGKGVRMNGF